VQQHVDNQKETLLTLTRFNLCLLIGFTFQIPWSSNLPQSLLVCTHFGHCIFIWDPFLSKDIELLESVQIFSSKVCTKQCREPYNSLQTSLKLPLLKDRRAVLKPLVLYKYLYGLVVMPPNTFAPLTHSGRNLCCYNFYLRQPFAHSNSYLYSCVPNSVSLWNHFPVSVYHCVSLSSFTSCIKNFV